MNNIKQIPQIIFVLLLLTNLVFLPITINHFIKSTKTIYYKKEYRIKQEKIDSIGFSEVGSGYQGKAESYIVFYKDKKKTISFAGNKALIRYEILRKRFNHFDKTVLSAFYERNKQLKNDSIWVWEHPIAPDHYAMGKEDRFTIDLYVKRLFFNLSFIVIAIVSIFWIKKNIKFK